MSRKSRSRGHTAKVSNGNGKDEAQVDRGRTLNICIYAVGMSLRAWLPAVQIYAFQVGQRRMGGRWSCVFGRTKEGSLICSATAPAGETEWSNDKRPMTRASLLVDVRVVSRGLLGCDAEESSDEGEMGGCESRWYAQPLSTRFRRIRSGGASLTTSVAAAQDVRLTKVGDPVEGRAGSRKPAKLASAQVYQEQARDMPDNDRPTPVGSTGHAGLSTSGFRPPADPAIPQDLSIIMEMVAQHQVVGSLPALSMTAAEKRKLVEASFAKGKGKAKAVDLPQSSASTAQQTIASDSDSDSSSEWESSEEEAERALEILGPEDEGEFGTSRAIEDHPMTEVEHETIKKELTELIGPPPSSNAAQQVEEESSGDSSSEEESEDEAEVGDKEFEFSSSPLPTPKLGRMTEILDEDDDPHAGDPILSLHEVPLPPVPQPPITKLPEGEKLSLAGDVISWMREKRVEAWLEKELARKATKPSEEDVQAAAAPQITSNTTEVASEAVETSPVQAAPSPDQAADSSVPPNKATLVDSWAPSTSSTPATASGAQERLANPPAQSSSSASKASAPRFTSAGTVVVRAMQSRAGAADEGWLEEGSVICWEDGRVLGTVSCPSMYDPLCFCLHLGIRDVWAAHLTILPDPPSAPSSPVPVSGHSLVGHPPVLSLESQIPHVRQHARCAGPTIQR